VNLVVHRTFALLFTAAFACGCRSLPKQYASAPGRSLVEGIETNNGTNPKTALFGVLLAPLDLSKPASTTRVEIINVDGNPLPATTAFYYANKAWLEPGIHRVTFFCSTAYSDQALFSGTNIEIDVQAGCNYYITSKPLEIVSAHPLRVTAPQIEVTEMKTK
jgi:hypothetical protein